MVTVAALISGSRIRKHFPIAIVMHRSFTALCAQCSHRIPTRRKRDKWMTSEQAYCTVIGTVFPTTTLSQKNNRTCPKTSSRITTFILSWSHSGSKHSSSYSCATEHCKPVCCSFNLTSPLICFTELLSLLSSCTDAPWKERATLIIQERGNRYHVMTFIEQKIQLKMEQSRMRQHFIRRDYFLITKCAYFSFRVVS